MTWTLERKSLLAVSLVIVLLVLVDFSQYENFGRMATGSEWVTHTGQVLQQLGTLESRITATESAARGYVIAGDSHARTAYDLAIGQTQSALYRLRQLTLDNPSQQRRLELFVPLLDRRLALLEQLVASRADVNGSG